MKTLTSKKINGITIMVAVLTPVTSSCSSESTPAPTQDTALLKTQAAQTVVADLTQNAPSPRTQAPAPTEAAPPPGPTSDPNIPIAVVPTAAPGEPSAFANYNTTIPPSL